MLGAGTGRGVKASSPRTVLGSPGPAASREARGGGRLGPVCRVSRPEHPKELEALAAPGGRKGRPDCAGKPRGAKRGTFRLGAVTLSQSQTDTAGRDQRILRWGGAGQGAGGREGARPGVFCSLPILESPRPWRDSAGISTCVMTQQPPNTHPRIKAFFLLAGLRLPERACSRSWGPVPSPRTHWRKGSGSLQTPGTTRLNEDGENRSLGKGMQFHQGPRRSKPRPEAPSPSPVPRPQNQLPPPVGCSLAHLQPQELF